MLNVLFTDSNAMISWNNSIVNAPIQNLCVVGAGFMGTQIALQAAAHGKSVTIYDQSKNALHQNVVAFEQCLERMISDGFADTTNRLQILERVSRCVDLQSAVDGVDLVIEAITENLDAKRVLFGQLDSICAPQTIFATNSSSIRISRIETATERQPQLLNTHFVQPVWKHPFVELMRGQTTSDLTMDSVAAFMKSIAVMPVFVRKESTGFVFNRIWRAVKKEALKVVDQGIATVEDVDRTWMIQMESPMGPLAAMDVIGLDVIRDIELIYFEESGDPSDEPPKVLLDKVANGDLGVKTGRGFYSYPNPNWQDSDFLKVACDP